MLVLALAAGGLVGLHVGAYETVGPVDELQHIDYLYRIPEVVRSGDLIERPAMREQACRGLDANIAVPTCDTPVLRPEEFQEGGFNTAYIHPPTYYAITRGVAELLRTIARVPNLVTAGRLAGIGWLLAGLSSTYAAGRLLGAGRGSLVSVLVAVAASPAMLMPAATVNPDSASLAVGGICLWCVLRWEQERRRAWPLLIVCAAVAELVKLQNLVVLLALGLYLLIRAIAPSTVDGRSEGAPARVPWVRDWRPLAAGAVLFVAAAVIAGAWSAVIRSLALIPPEDLPMSQRFLVDGFPMAGLLVPFGAFVTPLADPYLVPPLRSAWTAIFSELTVWLLLLGLLATALLGGVHERVAALARSWAIVGLLGGPILVVLNYFGQRQYIELPVRYALTLVPGLVVVTACALTTLVARRVAAALAVVSFTGVSLLLAV